MENIRIDEFLNYKFLSGIKYSPNGQYGCFVVHSANVQDNNYISNLWIYKKQDNSLIQLTNLYKESSFIWLDDSNILFSAMRNPKDKEKRESGEEFTQYYSINIHGGEAKEAFRINRTVTSIKKVDENTFIFTSSFNPYKPDVSLLTEAEKKEELTKRKEERDYEVLEEIPFWSNGGGFTNKNRNRLYIFKIDEAKYYPITDEVSNASSVNFNEDKTKAVFVASTFEGKMNRTNSMYILDLSSNEVEKITDDKDFNYSSPYFMTDDNIIFTGKDMKDYGLNQNNKFFRLDLNTKEITCITPDFDYSTGNSVGSDCRYGTQGGMVKDQEYLYFVTTQGENSYLNRINIEGKIETVISSDGTVDDYTVKNGEILFIGFRGQSLQELYKIEDNKETKVSDFNGWLNREKKISVPQKLTIETDKGVYVDGWVMKPVDFEEGKKYPAILDIHGGPKTAYSHIFYHEMQYWANEGYVVFFCNPRGSDGKGNAFADIRGKYGTIDYEDIMKFTDEVLERYSFIDKDRVGVTGGSYGGFMTNWIIGHTHRFKAAASQRSISNWISKFATTDIGYFFVNDQNGTTPWEDQAKLWEQSPLKYADKVKTPTLFIHSEEDYRCWVVEGIQMFTALKFHGVEARMCMFRGENHELSRSGKPKHRIRRLKEITQWFDKYLK